MYVVSDWIGSLEMLWGDVAKNNKQQRPREQQWFVVLGWTLSASCLVSLPIIAFPVEMQWLAFCVLSDLKQINI